MTDNALFQSFFMGGFECSSHRLRSGGRLDLIDATAHDQHAVADYRRLHNQGIRVVRDGLRWHLIERTPGSYDWSSVLPLLHAARETGTQIIWDLCHYGWPDDIDIWKPAFVDRFARLAHAFAKLVAQETDTIPFYSPINEISFWGWGGGDVAYLNPWEQGRGFELKAQLVRAAIEGIEAIWTVDRRARIVHADPVINIIAASTRPEDVDETEGQRLAQYQAWDMLAGRVWPQLGGNMKYLDLIGVNYYRGNQWIAGGPVMLHNHPRYRPFRQILAEVYARYQRPVFVAETGAEAKARAPWLRYICSEVRAAMQAGVPIEGVCLYPIVNHPGWDDDRHCPNGLWGYASADGERTIFRPLAHELHRQQQLWKLMQRHRAAANA